MAKETIPWSKNETLIKMQLFNDAEKLKTASTTHYQHHSSRDEMYATMVRVVKEEFKEDLIRSPLSTLLLKLTNP